MSRCLIFTVLFVSLVIASPSHAAIEWERTSARKEASLDQQAVTADFAFTNRGDQTLKITDLHTSCGCTAGQLAKRTYKPGETGRVRIRYEIAPDHRGTYQSSVIVRTNDRENPVTTLRLHTKLPKVLYVKPGRVFYEETQATRTVRVGILKPHTIKRLEIGNLPSWLKASWSNPLGEAISDKYPQPKAWLAEHKETRLPPSAQFIPSQFDRAKTPNEPGKARSRSKPSAAKQKDTAADPRQGLLYRLDFKITDPNAASRVRLQLQAVVGEDNKQSRLIDVVTVPSKQ